MSPEKKHFKGSGSHTGIACGKAVIHFFCLFQSFVTQNFRGADEEIRRFESAKLNASKLLSSLQQKSSGGSKVASEVLEMQLMMLEDEEFLTPVYDAIKNKNQTVESAVTTAANDIAQVFNSMEDEYMRERSADILGLAELLLTSLPEHNSQKTELVISGTNGKEVILCVDDIRASDLMQMDLSGVAGVVSALGAPQSHAALILKSFGIPAVFGIGKEFFQSVSDGERIVFDSATGEVILNPDDEVYEDAENKISEERIKEIEAKSKSSEYAKTTDGKMIYVSVNASGVWETSIIRESGCDGVGLFRSEFQYFGRDTFPTEDELYDGYKQFHEGLGEKPIVIRTLDVGSDKKVGYLNMEYEENPALGSRAMRYCFSHLDIFQTQVRAILRASAHGQTGIMFPMITFPEEVIKIKTIINKIKAEYNISGIKYSPDLKLGVMIETPSSAILSDEICPLVDFISIGTNDLSQYTFAYDRTKKDITELYPGNDKKMWAKAILRLIETIVQNAHKNNIPVSVCGDLASDEVFIPKLIELGVDGLSVPPSSVGKVKNLVRTCCAGSSTNYFDVNTRCK